MQYNGRLPLIVDAQGLFLKRNQPNTDLMLLSFMCRQCFPRIALGALRRAFGREGSRSLSDLTAMMNCHPIASFSISQHFCEIGEDIQLRQDLHHTCSHTACCSVAEAAGDTP